MNELDHLFGFAHAHPTAMGVWTMLETRAGDRANALMPVVARLKPGVTLAQSVDPVVALRAE